MNLSVVPASAIASDAWDALVDESPEGWMWALSGWQRLILAVSEWAFTDFSFAATLDGVLAGVMPLQFDARGARMASSAWGVAGPVLHRDLDRNVRRQVFAAMLREAETRAAGAGASRLDLGYSPLIPASLTAPWGVNPFIEFGFADDSTHTRMLDLTVGLPTLWAGVSENAKRKIKLSRSRGIEVREVDWPASVDAYYAAHTATYQRTGVSPHPRAYFAGMAREMAPRGHTVLRAGFLGDRAIAFRNDARFGAGVVYHTGCSLDEALSLGVNYHLVWDSIEAAVRDGYRWYELGEVFPDVAEGKRHGLTAFKSRFGGDLHRSFKAHRTIAARSSPEPAAISATAAAAPSPAPAQPRPHFIRRWLGRS